jgi:Flp pilus assembly pilin Flp
MGPLTHGSARKLGGSSPRKEVTHLLTVIRTLAARLRREEGQTIIEYGMVLGGISIVLIGLFVATGLSDEFTTLVNNIANELT